MQELKKSIMEEIKEIDDCKQLEIVLGLVILMRNQLKAKKIDAMIQSETVDKKCMETQTEAENIIFKVPMMLNVTVENDLGPTEALDLSKKDERKILDESDLFLSQYDVNLRRKSQPNIMVESDLLLSQNTVNNLLNTYHLAMDDATQIITADTVDSVLDGFSICEEVVVPKEITALVEPSIDIIGPKVITERDAKTRNNPLKRGYKVVPEQKPIVQKKRRSLAMKKPFDCILDQKFPTIRLNYNEMTNNSRYVREMLAQKSNSTGYIHNDAAITLYVEDIKELLGNKWLNDNIVNGYLSLVQSRSIAVEKLPQVAVINTHFFRKFELEGYKSVKKWLTVKALEYALMTFIPIHRDNHWSLIVIDNFTKTVTYYCPLMRSTNNLQIMKHLFISMNMNIEKWQFVQTSSFPKQTDQHNCGVFICQAVEYLSRQAPLNFSGEDMAYFREKMAFELYKNKLFS